MNIKAMKNTPVYLGCFFLLIFLCSNLRADESRIIKADRQALAEMNASGVSSKIISAKEQLSDDLGMEADQRHKDLEGIIIPLVPDGQGHLLADVLINNKIHASLIVDTGSPLVLLTSSFIQKLGLNLSQSNVGYVEVLNGKYKAAAVSLDSIKLGGAQGQDVSAVVLLEDSKEIKDGLLGLSFLSKFHFTLDQTGQKLILRRLE
jgi:clan AA aspartic protease (TIGR02281 family)